MTNAGDKSRMAKSGFHQLFLSYVYRFWAPVKRRVFSEWGCLENIISNLFVDVPNLLCTINNTNNIYFCCNNTDYCNNVTLQLPRETLVPTTEGVVQSASTSPPASTEGKIERPIGLGKYFENII